MNQINNPWYSAKFLLRYPPINKLLLIIIVQIQPFLQPIKAKMKKAPNMKTTVLKNKLSGNEGQKKATVLSSTFLYPPFHQVLHPPPPRR